MGESVGIGFVGFAVVGRLVGTGADVGCRNMIKQYKVCKSMIYEKEMKPTSFHVNTLTSGVGGLVGSTTPVEHEYPSAATLYCFEVALS